MWPNKRLEQLKVIRTSQSTWTCRATRFGTVWNYCKVFPTDTSTWHIPYLKKMKRRWLETIPVDGKFHHRCPLWAVDFQSCLGLYTWGSPSVVWPMKPMTSNDEIWQKQWCATNFQVTYGAMCRFRISRISLRQEAAQDSRDLWRTWRCGAHLKARPYQSCPNEDVGKLYKNYQQLRFFTTGNHFGYPMSYTWVPCQLLSRIQPHFFSRLTRNDVVTVRLPHALPRFERAEARWFVWVWLKMGHCHWGGES